MFRETYSKCCVVFNLSALGGILPGQAARSCLQTHPVLWHPLLRILDQNIMVVFLTSSELKTVR